MGGIILLCMPEVCEWKSGCTDGQCNAITVHKFFAHGNANRHSVHDIVAPWVALVPALYHKPASGWQRHDVYDVAGRVGAHTAWHMMPELANQQAAEACEIRCGLAFE